MLASAPVASAAPYVRPIQFMLVASVGFVGLQLYWLSLFIRVSLAQGQRKSKRKRRQQQGEEPSHGE